MLTSRSSGELIATTDDMKMAIASLSLLGVGCSAGYYLAPAGFFEHTFKSNTFFLKMIMAICLPYPVILLLQEKFDEHFDSVFGPRQTYFFRVIAMQMMLACVFAGYSMCAESPAGVLICGVLIGCFTAAALASTMQLMAAWDPHLNAWASMGKDVAGALAVITYSLRAFSASEASSWEFQSMQLFPIVIICLSAMFLTGLHSVGIWDKAYARLGYDLWDGDFSVKRRQVSESDPLLAADELDSSGQPYWISAWQVASMLSSFLSFMLLPLVSLMHNPDLTQKLTLGKLTMDCLSRCFAALLSRTDVFGVMKPRHYMLIVQLALRTLMFALMLSHLLQLLALSVKVFSAIWFLHYFLGSFLASQIDVTIVRFAPVALRKSISRRNTLASYSGLALGLFVDIAILFAN